MALGGEAVAPFNVHCAARARERLRTRPRGSPAVLVNAASSELDGISSASHAWSGTFTPTALKCPWSNANPRFT